MASVFQEQRNGKTSYRIQFTDGDKRRRKLRLGAMNRKDAEAIASKVDALNAAKISGRPWEPSLASWVANLGTELAGKLAEAGLCELKAKATLGDFLRQFIAAKESEAAPNTLANFRQVEKNLVAFFGFERDLRSIGEGNADDWRQSLADRYSPATLSMYVKRTRQVFKAAVRKRLCESNPFLGLKGGSERNDDRKAFVSQATIAKVLEAAPDAEWRAIIALARYGGLRCPSEILGLRWQDIDWARGRFTVTSPKTKKHGKGWRVVPLFPELQPWLSDAHEVVPDGSQYVVSRYRDASANMRTQFLRILRKAGVEPWERVFQNLRASRETELANNFPLHVVTGWLGNTPMVATQHYLQTTEEHFLQASGGATGGAQVGQMVGRKPPEASRNQPQETRKASGIPTLFAENPEAFTMPKYPQQESNL